MWLFLFKKLIIKKMNIKNALLELFKTVLTSLLIVIVIYFFIAMPVTISGSSMYPNLEDGEFGFAGKISLLTGIKRYDVVVIDSPKTSDKIVKRVIGLPGETLTFDGTTIFVDGEAIDDPYAYYAQVNSLDLPSGYSVTLDDDEYFVLGDNRNVSKDSRAYEDPAFKKSEIIAKGILVLFPFDEIGVH